MILTDLQLEKVNEILNYFQQNKRKVDFKAPTGSGKTLMASALISKIINNNIDKKFIFIIATISSSDLPRAFENKINQYKNNLDYSDFEVEYIESPSTSKTKNIDIETQLIPIKNKVYIFGKASFGKDRIFTIKNTIKDFVNECKTQDYKIVYIRDEAHYGTRINKKDAENFETLMEENAYFILRMTATLDMKNIETMKVKLTEKELNDINKNNNKWLLKTEPITLSNNLIEDKDLLKKSINDFINIKEEYKTLDLLIRTALLIQVDNEQSDNDKKIIFKNTLQMIKDELKINNLSWVQYFGENDKDSSNVDNKNFTLQKITRNDDPTDVIIFKIGPATGWDIPRASMLLQLRNVCSKNLNIQTIGRIKRNPYKNLEKHDITTKYYIYSNAPKSKDNDLNVYQYEIKDIFKTEEMLVIRISKDRAKKTQKVVDEDLIKEIMNFLKEKIREIERIENTCFDYKENIYKNINEKIILKDPIQILKYIKIKETNFNENYKNALDIIKTKYKEVDEDLKNFKLETLLIILYDNFLSHIKDIIQKSLFQNIKYEIKTETIKPDIYTEIKEDEKNRGVIGEEYLFNIKKNGEKYTYQVLDSHNENVIFSHIVRYSRDIKL